MKDWTRDGANVAGLALLVVGAAGVATGAGWYAVALVGLAVALLVALAVVGHFSDVRENLSLKSDVGALKMALHRLEEAHAKTEETAKSALSGVVEARNRGPARPVF